MDLSPVAARGCGFRTAFDVDVVADDLRDLAARLGC